MHLGSMTGCFTKCTEVTVFWLLTSMPRPGSEGTPVPQAPAEDGVGTVRMAVGNTLLHLHAALLRRDRPGKGAAQSWASPSS